MGSDTDATEVAGVLCGCAVGLVALALCAWWSWARFARPHGRHAHLGVRTSVTSLPHYAQPADGLSSGPTQSRAAQPDRSARGHTEGSVQPMLASSPAPPRAVHRAAVVATFFDSPTHRGFPPITCPLPRDPEAWAPHRGSLLSESTAHVSNA